MNNEQILEKITPIIRVISSNKTLEVTQDTVFEEIEGWDSLNTVDLEMEIESVLNISFETGEFVEYDTVKQLIIALETKLN